GVRLDDHPRPILLQGAADMCRSPRGIAHIMQTIEKCDEVVVLARIVFRFRHLKSNPLAYTRILRPLLRSFNGLVVIVVTYKLRLRIRLRHQNRRRAKSAPYVSNATAT